MSLLNKYMREIKFRAWNGEEMIFPTSIMQGGTACWRENSVIEKKELEQWFFKITDYKQRLIDDLSKVNYPEKLKVQTD